MGVRKSDGFPQEANTPNNGPPNPKNQKYDGYDPWEPNPCMHTKRLDNPAAEAALAADLFTATPDLTQ